LEHHCVKIKYAIEGLGIAVEPPSPEDAPKVYNVDPNSASRRGCLMVTISGANFQNATTVDFGEGVIVQAVTIVSAEELTVQIRVYNRAEPGPHDVTVINPDGQGDALIDGCTVEN
jgi:hypothetical protein